MPTPGRHRVVLTALLVCALAPVAHAWQKAIRFDRISVEQGLPDSWVRSIEQDRFGFMWFSTPNGLAKYDGYRFTVYRHDPSDPQSVSSNEILSVLEDHEGMLWVGTDAGLDRFDREREVFEHFRHDPADLRSLGGPVVPAISEDSSGQLWIGHWASGLSRLDRTQGTFERFQNDPADPSSLPPGTVFTMLEDSRGGFWVGTFARQGGSDLARFDPESETFRRFFSCDREAPGCPKPADAYTRPKVSKITDIVEDRKGQLWIAVLGFGVVRYDPVSNTYFRYFHDPEIANSLAGDTVNSIVEDDDGRLWFSDLRDGLTILEPETMVFSRYRHDPLDPKSLAGDSAYRMYKDRDGLLWISCVKDGLSRFDPLSLALGLYRFDRNDPLGITSVVRIRSVAETDDGALWISLPPDGLDRVDRALGVVRAIKHDPDDLASLPSDEVRDLLVSQSGQLWLTTPNSLISYDLASDAFSQHPLEPRRSDSTATEVRDDALNTILEGPAGSLWLGSYTSVYRFEPSSGQVEVFHPDPGKTDALHGDNFEIQLIEEDGTVWISSQSAGLNVYDPATGGFRHYQHEPGNPDTIPQGPCCHIGKAPDGTLWLGTQSGLGTLDPESGVFARYTGSDRLPSGRIDEILFDGSGKVWVSAYTEGLWKIDPASGESWNYTVADGLEEGPGENGFVSQIGELVLWGDEGINIFRPDSLSQRQAPLDVVFTEFRLQNRPVPVSNHARATPLEKSINFAPEVTLTHADYLFSFEFAAPHFREPMNTRYAYKLEGFDGDWIETDATNRNATYTRIPPGDYRLRIKAGDKNGRWSSHEASLVLHVLPPWWRTWWAYTAYLLVFLLALAIYVRLRTLSLKRRAATLEQTVAERTQQIVKHEQQIESQAHELEAALDLKEKLITNISHEFRTPLTLILGPVKRLMDRSPGPEEAVQLQTIRRSGQRLLRLVDQLLGLARLGSVENHAARKAQPVLPVARAIVESFRPLAANKGLELALTVDGAPWVEAEADALEIVLLNLLSNAVKYTPEGGSITVEVEGERDGQVRLAVSDTGIGIPFEEQGTVFDRFRRAGAVGEHIPGAGIGLALVSDVVEAHDGTVRLESEPGKGTRVEVLLPAYVPTEQDLQRPREAALTPSVEQEFELLSELGTTAPAAITDSDDGKPLVLIVEDNADLQNYLAGLLDTDYHCYRAGDGEQALQLAYEQIPDLVLLDLMLPGLDGFQVSHALKEDQRTSHIPIIMLTARQDRESRMGGWREKVDAYFTKPFDDDELRLRIANLLEIRDILRNRYRNHFFEDTSPAEVLNDKETRFVERLEKALETGHADPEFGVSRLASEVFMSTRQLQRKLKSVVGHSPAEYLRSFRLRRSCELLRSGVQVSQVADAVGFSSPAYFTSCFKAQFEQTPSEYQQQLVAETGSA